MINARRLYDWRVRCDGCGYPADVRAVDEEDAIREAKSKRGFAVHDDGMVCGNCFWELTRQTTSTHDTQGRI